MGLSVSVNHLPSGKSLRRHRFITLTSLSLESCGWNTCMLKKWEDEPWLMNPSPEYTAIKLPKGIVFTVVNVYHKSNFIDSPAGFTIQIQFAFNIPIASIQKRVVVQPSYLSDECYKQIPLYQVNKDALEKLFDRKHNVFALKDFICDAYKYDMFSVDSKDFTANKYKPLQFNPELLRELF